MCVWRRLTSRGAYVMVVNKLSFMASLPAHATDHSSASMANYGAFAILDMPRFWLKVWRDFGAILDELRVDRAHALFTDAGGPPRFLGERESFLLKACGMKCCS